VTTGKLGDPASGTFVRRLRTFVTLSAIDVQLSTTKRTAKNAFKLFWSRWYHETQRTPHVISRAFERYSDIVTFRRDVVAGTHAPWTGDRGTLVELRIAQSEITSLKARILEIDLVWPGFAEGDEPLEIGTEKTSK
jgi:hypothetical protein